MAYMVPGMRLIPQTNPDRIKVGQSDTGPIWSYMV